MLQRELILYVFLIMSQVFGAVQQAIQRGPHYPESHNLYGLVCEARSDYQAAVVSYRLARYAISSSSGTVPNSHFQDISINLARSLSRVNILGESSPFFLV